MPSSPGGGRSVRWNRALAVRVLALVYFVSGACSLIDEVVWTRLLKLSLGNTVYASSIVISVFMGGLALGALIMARFCGRIRQPLRLYALIELLITISVLLSPKAIGLLDSFYVWFWQMAHPSSGVLIVCQTALSALVLLIPTVLMGSTLPLLSRVVTAVEDDAGTLVSRLYALNTLGAAAGCFLAGFVLIRSLGVMATLWTAAMLNLGVVVAAYAIHVLSGRQTFEVSSDEPAAPQEAPTAGRSRAEPALLAVAFFVSGLACIGYELLWMRSIVHSVGAFTYVFSAVLTVYLIGNVIGTALGTLAVRSRKNPGATYAAIFFLLGLCGVLYIPWLHLCNFYLLPWISAHLEDSLWRQIVPWRMLRPMTQCLVLFLVPSTIMGIGFPFMVQAWIRHVHRVGRTVGSAYSVNTIGAVAGGLVTGFICIPFLGLQKSIILLGLLVLWLAAVMWFALARPVRRAWLVRSIPLLTALCVTLRVPLIPADLFNRTVALSFEKEHDSVVDVRTGINTTVSIHRDHGSDDLFLYTSGRMVAGTSPGYRGDQKMLGHFPVLLNPAAESVLTVGFGTGESTACLNLHNLERNDCVEIAPEVLEMSLKYFTDLNLGPRHTEEVNVILMDARNYLHLTEQTYDVIVNDCTSIRGFAENSSLYTRDYLECARRHLNENGLFMSWIDTYASESTRVVNALLGTMLDAFPHVTLWYMLPEPSPFFVVVGSNEPQSFRIPHIAREMDNRAVAKSLLRINIERTEDVLSCYVANQDDLRRYLRRYACNTDDHPFVEFCTAERPAGYAMLRQFFQGVASDSVYRHLDWTDIDPRAQAQWLAGFDRLRRATRHVLLAQTARTPWECIKHCLDGLETMPDYHVLQVTRIRAEKDLAKMVKQALAARDLKQAQALTDVFLKVEPDAAVAWILQSQIERLKCQPEAALRAARRAVDVAPQSLAALHNLWGLLLANHEAEEAQDLFDRAVDVYGRLDSPELNGSPGGKLD